MNTNYILAIIFVFWTGLALSQDSIFEKNKYYRLTNMHMGESRSLAVNMSNEASLLMAPNDSVWGQFWKITKQEDGLFNLSCKWQGESKVIDVVNGDNFDELSLANKGNYSGQFWKIEQSEIEGYYRITNQWQEDKSLDCDNEIEGEWVGLKPTGIFSGQFWKITEINTIDESNITKINEEIISDEGQTEKENLKMSIEDEKNLVEYSKAIHFNSGGATIKKSTFAALDAIVTILKKYPNTKFVIEGHTDSTGRKETNKRISASRAARVMNYFISAGIDPSRLTFIGHGEEDPIASNNTRFGRSQNRRIEINMVKE